MRRAARFAVPDTTWFYSAFSVVLLCDNRSRDWIRHIPTRHRCPHLRTPNITPVDWCTLRLAKTSSYISNEKEACKRGSRHCSSCVSISRWVLVRNSVVDGFIFTVGVVSILSQATKYRCYSLEDCLPAVSTGLSHGPRYPPGPRPNGLDSLIITGTIITVGRVSICTAQCIGFSVSTTRSHRLSTIHSIKAPSFSFLLRFLQTLTNFYNI